MADVEIRPGIITRDPFYIASKPAREVQKIIYRGDADWCHVSFPSVAPWIFVVPQEFQIGGDNDDGTRHREISIYIQTDNPAFPKNQKSIEVALRVIAKTPGQTQNLQIPIYLRNIQPIPDFDGVFAMDFGTTSTGCAFIEHHDGSSTVKTIKFDDLGWGKNKDTIASLLYFLDTSNATNPSYEIGFPAVQMWASGDAPITAFKYSVKRYLGTTQQTFVLNNRGNAAAKPVFYSYEQLAQFVVSRIISRAEDALKKRIRKIVATYPTTFSTGQFRAVERVFQNVGFSGDGLNMAWDEATAATVAYFYEQVRKNGIHTVKALLPSPVTYVLTFDFGGGTTDITVIEVAIEEEDDTHTIRTDIVGITGDKYLGGDNVTLELFRVIKARIAMFVAEQSGDPQIQNEQEKETFLGARNTLRDNYLETVKKALETGQRLDAEVSRIVNDVLPTRFSLEGAIDDQPRKHFYELWDVAELMKKRFGTRDEQTGEYPEQVKLEVPLPKIGEYTGVADLGLGQVNDIVVKRADYEAHLAPQVRTLLERAKRLLPRKLTCPTCTKEIIVKSGMTGCMLCKKPFPPEFDAIQMQLGTPMSFSLAILAGNSSNLPIVRTLVREMLDLTDQRIYFDPIDAKIAVAKGACFARRNELVPSVIKYELGSLLRRLPWDVGCKVEAAPFDCFFKRGTELPTKTPFVYRPKFDVKLLQISTRLSSQDEPEAIGFFDFSSDQGDKDAPPPPPEVKKAQAGAAGAAKAGGKDKSKVAPITVWIDDDRRIGAEKNGKYYAFRPKPEVFPPDLDPYSGIH